MPNLFPLAQNFLGLLAFWGLSLTGLSAAAFWLFKKFGESWLDAKFNQQLEGYKHEQQRELEKLRFNINALMDRTIKLHQHEFDVLPEVWARLTDAYAQTANFVSPLQTNPDLERMGDAQKAEFLAKSELADWQKDELKSGRDINNRYFKMIFWHKLNRVSHSYASYQEYLVKNGIFIQPELKQKLIAFSDMLYDAISERRFEEESPNPRADRFVKCERLRKEGKKIFEGIEGDVQTRLWNARSLNG